METGRLYFFIIIALIFPSQVSSHHERFFSFSQPGIPTEEDSVFIESMGFYIGGKIYDSSISVNGNDIFLNYIVQDTSVYVAPHIYKKNGIGTLPRGKYRIITSTFSVNGKKSPPDTALFRDTSAFQVEPAGKTPPRIVWKCMVTGYPIGVTDPPTAYYYWNGDTVSVAIAYFMGHLARLTTYLRQSNDTLVLTVFDTIDAGMLLCQSTLVVASLHPAKPGKYAVKTILKIQNVWNEENNFSVDNTRKGVGFSFKKPDAPEIIVYPDSALTYYRIFLPLLDSVKLLGIRPNPYYLPTGIDSLLISGIEYAHPSMTVQNWKSFEKNDWHFVHAQPSDSLAFDTMSVGGYPYFKMRYSGNGGNAVKSYIYRTLDSTLVATTAPNEVPEIYLNILTKIPATSTFPDGQTVTPQPRVSQAVRIRASGARVRVDFQSPSSLSPAHAAAKITMRVMDIRGRIVSELAVRPLSGDAAIVSAVWDRRDAAGKPVAAGAYFILVREGKRRYTATMPPL